MQAAMTLGLMRFIDEAKIKIVAGHGGPGCVSFRRETFAPRGGPDGGDGGEGGNVVFEASDNFSTLQDFRYKREYKAPNGMHGSGSNKAGRDGLDIVLKIPVGTLIKDQESGEILQDFTTHGQKWVATQGGRGGKGNAHFVTSTFQAPKFAQPGEAGEFKDITLELKLLADAAIIGFPNAGKSTLISRMSAARPKIADYAFTTLTPNLGVVASDEHRNFVIADIPGLIEGAHTGLGLGHKFLKHIERTRVFVHLLDGSKILEDATKPTKPGEQDSFDAAIDGFVERYKIIRNELGLFNEALLHKPEIVVLNKVDLLESDPELVERARLALRQSLNSLRGVHPYEGEPFVISCATGRGVTSLTHVIQKIIDDSKKPEEIRAGLMVTLPDDPAIRRTE